MISRQLRRTFGGIFGDRLWLRDSEAARQAAILNALPAQIALLDVHGHIISVNNAWRCAAMSFHLPSPDHGLGINYLAVCDVPGHPPSAVVTHVDITEHRRIDDALRRQQTELRALFDLLPAMIWFKDTANRILRVNNQVARAAADQ